MTDRPSAQGDPRETLERLLRESEELRRRSDELAAEVERLRRRIERSAAKGHPPERRRKPRTRGT